MSDRAALLMATRTAWFGCAGALLATVIAFVSNAAAVESDVFRGEVVPIILRHCIQCHNSADLKGGLDLTSESSLRKGGDSENALVPGQPEQSLLWQYVEGDDMPPKGKKLTGPEKQALRKWIEGGALWTGGKIDPFEVSTDRRAGYDWWAFQPIAASIQPPTLDHDPRVKNDIDRFLLHRLSADHLGYSPRAEARTLIRRLYFDLIGLPPTPEQVEAFEADPSDRAYERIVDSLLASAHFGERWARHWFDVVRFGESQGFERNWHLPLAWRYRDWVIDALNRDLPYDEFIRQQIAGDILSPHDPRGFIATGFLTCGPWDMASALNGSASMKRMAREAELEEQMGTLGQAFLGLTLHCARCHDHKYDPVTTKDYYQMSASLGGVHRGYPDAVTAGLDETARSERAELERRIAALRQRMARLDSGLREPLLQKEIANSTRQVESLTKRLAELNNTLDNQQTSLAELTDPVARLERQAKIKNSEREIRRNTARLDAEQRRMEGFTRSLPVLPYEKIVPELPDIVRPDYQALIFEVSPLELRYDLLSGGKCYAVVASEPGIFHVLARGDFRQEREVVAPGGVAAIQNPRCDFGLAADAPDADRRRQAALWISDGANPLPARVIANRLWHYHFGVGLVDTPNDFGFNGGRPTHPKLLDWLAQELIDHQWSLKHLHRLIVTSAAYRQQSDVLNPAAERIDAENRLLWRMNGRRLEAEAVRDAALSVSGELIPQVGGESYLDFQIKAKGMDDHYQQEGKFEEAKRRTLYRSWARSGDSPLLGAFDCPDPSVTAPKRTVTTTPAQALALLNDRFLNALAGSLARRARGECGPSIPEQVQRAYLLVYQRRADDVELAVAPPWIEQFGFERFCLMLLNTNEFVYLD